MIDECLVLSPSERLDRLRKLLELVIRSKAFNILAQALSLLHRLEHCPGDHCVSFRVRVESVRPKHTPTKFRDR